MSGKVIVFKIIILKDYCIIFSLLWWTMVSLQIKTQIKQKSIFKAQRFTADSSNGKKSLTLRTEILPVSRLQINNIVWVHEFFSALQSITVFWIWIWFIVCQTDAFLRRLYELRWYSYYYVLENWLFNCTYHLSGQQYVVFLLNSPEFRSNTETKPNDTSMSR